MDRRRYKVVRNGSQATMDPNSRTCKRRIEVEHSSEYIAWAAERDERIEAYRKAIKAGRRLFE